MALPEVNLWYLDGEETGLESLRQFHSFWGLWQQWLEGSAQLDCQLENLNAIMPARWSQGNQTSYTVSWSLEGVF